MDKTFFPDSELQIPQVFFGANEVKVHKEVDEPNLLVNFEYAVKGLDEVLELPDYNLTELIFLNL